MDWPQLYENGCRFHLTDDELLELRPFYERADKVLLERAGATFLDGFPQSEIEQHYPDAQDQARFGLLCVLAARPLLETHYREHGYSEKMLNEISADTAAWVQTFKRDLHCIGYPLKDLIRTTSWNQAQALGLSGVGRIQPGFAADLTVLSGDFEVEQVYVDGELRYKAE